MEGFLGRKQKAEQEDHPRETFDMSGHGETRSEARGGSFLAGKGDATAGAGSACRSGGYWSDLVHTIAVLVSTCLCSYYLPAAAALPFVEQRVVCRM